MTFETIAKITPSLRFLVITSTTLPRFVISQARRVERCMFRVKAMEVVVASN